ncbi:MAG: hypothetical protein JRH20_28200 [Deltaproteobacteria bacterium]|nr:hypothetical protein [Deltaproteobacteria bacterium]
MQRARRKVGRIRRVALFFGLTLLGLGAVGCISIEHLGDQTGVAFNRVFAEQAGGKRRLKRMEAELATVAAKRFSEDKPMVSRGPKLTVLGSR